MGPCITGITEWEVVTFEYYDHVRVRPSADIRYKLLSLDLDIVIIITSVSN